MKKIISAGIFSLLLFPSSINAQQEYSVSPEAEAFFASAMSQINERHINWIKSTAAEAKENNLSADDIMNRTRRYAAVSGNLNGQDIEALCSLVLMLTAKDAQEDLKQLMAGLKALNEQKEKLKSAMSMMNDRNQSFTRIRLDSLKSVSAQTQLLQRQNYPGTIQPVRYTGQDSVKTERVTRAVTQTEINTTRDKIKRDLDSINEMGEMLSLRLQMVMDRRSKAISTLSKMLKKISDTAQSIIQNLK